MVSGWRGDVIVIKMTSLSFVILTTLCKLVPLYLGGIPPAFPLLGKNARKGLGGMGASAFRGRTMKLLNDHEL